MPNDRVYDGYDLSPTLFKNQESPREELFFYHGTTIFAARKGDYKLYYYKNNPKGYPEQLEKLHELELYNIQKDPSERFNIIGTKPDLVKEIREMVKKHRGAVEPGEDQMIKKL